VCRVVRAVNPVAVPVARPDARHVDVVLKARLVIHVDALLGAEEALADFTGAFVDLDDEPVVTPCELKDSLWEYRTFRRRRFHWPEHYPGDGFRDEVRDNQSASTQSHFQRPRLQRFGSERGAFPRVDHSPEARDFGAPVTSTLSSVEGLTHVRTFRVFSTFKL